MHLHPPLLVLLLAPLLARAHGTPPADDPSLPWSHRHLISEHHITNYDPGAFFTLHDFDNNGFLTRHELLRTYGLPQPDVSRQREDEIWLALVHLICGPDAPVDAEISKEEWMKWAREGGTGGQLPDMGTGIGHHGDDEYEYEIHHFEKYHTEEDGEEMFVHPEDVEHFAKHEAAEEAEREEAEREKAAINLKNVPAKFRRTR